MTIEKVLGNDKFLFTDRAEAILAALKYREESTSKTQDIQLFEIDDFGTEEIDLTTDFQVIEILTGNKLIS